ncbi:hybrid signal transduction histidine kinase M [Tanacetum coccineum]
MLDEAFLPKMEVPTRWIKSIPIKVNVFAWKLYLDRLPTRSNLSRRNVSLPSLACPLCDHVLEDSSHLFFGCSVAKDIQKLICRWWNLDVHPYESYEDWLSWFKSIRLVDLGARTSVDLSIAIAVLIVATGILFTIVHSPLLHTACVVILLLLYFIMTITDATPTILLSDKLMTITNISTLIPVLLDVDEMNYSSLVYFFKKHCCGFQLLEHIEGKKIDEAASSTLVPPTSEGLKPDSIILSWIFTTMSKTLQQRLVVENPKTAKEAWDILAEIFSDNKRSRSTALKFELCSLRLGDLSIDAYFRKIESIATILASIGSPISTDDIVNIALDGLPEKYDHVSDIIIHREPFPDLKTVRSMLNTAEMRLKSRAHVTTLDASSSSPMVLLANSGTRNDRRSNGGSG